MCVYPIPALERLRQQECPKSEDKLSYVMRSRLTLSGEGSGGKRKQNRQGKEGNQKMSQVLSKMYVKRCYWPELSGERHRVD